MVNRVEDYKVVYYYSDNDNCYLATIPELPGCISDGETVQEAIANVRDLAKDFIEIWEDKKEEIPKPVLGEEPAGDSITINDVAYYILERTGDITTKALQKLSYYCNAWYLGWYKKPLFADRFEAWKDGPMNRGLFNKHRYHRIAKKDIFSGTNVKELSTEQKRFVDFILRVYDDFDGDELGKLTHKEEPWVVARNGLPDGANGDTEISEEIMAKYYGQ